MRNVYLFQPNYSTYSLDSIQSYYFPYSVGIIWSYASQSPVVQQHYQLADIFFKRDDPDSVVARLIDPAVAVFSNYLWNWEYNKILAKKIKDQWPDCVIVFGGPQVTDRPFEKLFFSHHRYVDHVINGEGELALQEILEQYAQGQRPKKIYKTDRIQDLNTIPSPYLTGLFDNLVKQNPDVTWHAVLETNRGCPYQCTFCDWGSLTYSKVKRFDEARVIAEVEWMAQNRCVFIYIADANFGIFVERDLALARAFGEIKARTGYPESFTVTMQKNSQLKNVEIARLLDIRGFTISVQSMDQEVLTAIKRQNMQVTNMSEVIKLCRQQGVPTYTEMILGLPRETFDTWKTGHFKLMEAGQHDLLSVYPAMLLENAEMSQQIDQYKFDHIEVDYFDDIADTSVKERVRLVRSTSTMSFDEFVEAYTFSWCITMFHYAGYTNLVSRYLHNRGIETFENFYNRLYEYAQHSSGIVAQQYQYTRSATNEYYTTGQFNQYPIKLVPNYLIWNSTFEFHHRASELKQELEDFISTHYQNFMSAEEFESLIALQNNYIPEYQKNYPYNVEILQSVYSEIFDVEYQPDPAKKFITVEVNNDVPKFKTIDDHAYTVFLKRRNGKSRNQLTVKV